MMMLVMIFVVAAIATMWPMAWLVRRDGYGLRPPPARDQAELDASTWPR